MKTNPTTNGAESLATGHDVARQGMVRARELLNPSQRTRSDFCAPPKKERGVGRARPRKTPWNAIFPPRPLGASTTQETHQRPEKRP
ncbi:hypothetical protein ROR02_31990 [Pararhodospirillum oryzae]|uniref:Uncharacterized protein n=1 Tax=Pararhodospirillum oryzae TaxID=478448 RepID=A0A512HC89_9PROT|nr:hypothetical protein ROR02_31990 [Pararhodospirillum oryzae]